MRGHSLPHPGPPGKVLPDLSRAHPHAGGRHLSFSQMNNRRQEPPIHAGGFSTGRGFAPQGTFWQGLEIVFVVTTEEEASSRWGPGCC